MYVSFEADVFNMPPANRKYLLELVHVPDEVVDPPDVGTRWQLPLDGPFNIRLPVYRSLDGSDGYRFSLHMTEVIPEPGGLLLLATGLLLVGRPRRRHRAKSRTSSS